MRRNELKLLWINSSVQKVYTAAVAKKDQLAKEVEQCTVRLDSAMKLIDGLGGEKSDGVQV